jgi:restriction system protein
VAPVAGTGPVRLTLSWQADPRFDDHVDLVALLVTTSGKVRSDADFVFFNTPATPEGSVRLHGRQTWAGRTADTLDVDPARVPGDIDKVVLAASLDAPGATFADLRELELTLAGHDPAAGSGCRVDLSSTGSETAYVAGELYRRAGAWKFRAVGQGWEAGLAALATEFGVSVADEQGSNPTAEPGPPGTAGAPAPVPAPAATRPDYSAVVARYRAIIAAHTPADPLSRLRDQAEQAAQAASQAFRYAVDPAGRRAYKETRQAEVTAMTAALEAEVGQLTSVLAASLRTASRVDRQAVTPAPAIPPFTPGQLGVAEPPPQLSSFLPTEQSALGRVFGRDKHAAAVAEAHQRFAAAQARHAERERQRQHQLADAHTAYQRAAAEVEARHTRETAEVDRLWAGLAADEPAAVAAYFELVLTAKGAQAVFPPAFPQRFQVAYTPTSRQLVVEYELPASQVVPADKGHKYTVGTDTVTPVPRTAADTKKIYAEVLAQTSLAVLHTLFTADRHQTFDTLVFNGMVDAIDRATGAAIRPCLVTLRTTRETFAGLTLAQVEPAACLRHLGASVSKNPAELAPVRPVLEFSMVDPRFIETSDVLSGMDTRQNLMELTPGGFEALITNLFTRMGLEARQTHASRDGGVDCVAFDARPIFGGKVVIQAKRYKNTVGVSAVRDLFGTVQNEGASKGILVTTSGYGQSSYQFATGKPLELIDGANLLYLLAEHAGVEARIAAPDGWRDPRSDTPPAASG